MRSSRLTMPLIGSLSLICNLAVAGNAQAASQKWGALSSTAIAVTGSVALSKKRLRLENGEVVPWRQVKQEGMFRLYEFTSEANPLLGAENQLCGDGPPSFALVHDNGTRMTLSVFERHSQPELNSMTHKQYGFCASYLYMLQ